jgi:biotin synthase
MCYSIPGKITSFIDHKTAQIDYFGQTKEVYFDIENLKLGDYIYAQGGYAIKKIPRKNAENILITWRETFFELQELDFNLSQLEHLKRTKNEKLHNILNKTAINRSLCKNEINFLAKLTSKEEISLLCKTSNYIRHQHLSNSCCIHGIIEISNYCSNSCKYCGISTFNHKIRRYRMDIGTLYNTLTNGIKKYNFQAFVLQTGEDPDLPIHDLTKLIKEITEKYNTLIFISFGEIKTADLKKLYNAGAKGLLMRFETSDEKLYSQMHPGKSYQKRIEYILEAKKLGYLIVTGSLIGLPGQTDINILHDIKTAKKLKPIMYSFGPFIPHNNTPLSTFKSPNTLAMLKTIALTRIIDPKNANILITSAFEAIDHNARSKGLLAGANSLMLNLTPAEFKHAYQLYPRKKTDENCLNRNINQTISFLKSIGRSPTDLGSNIQ